MIMKICVLINLVGEGPINKLKSISSIFSFVYSIFIKILCTLGTGQVCTKTLIYEGSFLPESKKRKINKNKVIDQG